VCLQRRVGHPSRLVPPPGRVSKSEGRAEIQVGAEHLAVSARTADPTERGRLFPRFVQMYKGYGAYEDKTSRQIPLVLLTLGPPNSTAFAW
jgi:hypothetical protein